MMTKPERIIRPAPVRRTIEVAVSQDRAFEVFTAGIGRWWPRHKSIGASPLAAVVLEPSPGGRWYETGRGRLARREWGKVLAWEPPGRLLLAWQIGADWTLRPEPARPRSRCLFRELGPRLTRVEIWSTASSRPSARRPRP